MRAVIGPVFLNLLLTATGLGVLAALELVEISVAGIAAGLGLAFCTGLTLVCVVVIATLVIGIPYSFTTVVVIAILLGAAGVAWRWLRRDSGGPRDRGGQRHREVRHSGDIARPVRRDVRTILRDHIGVILFVIFFTPYAIIGIFRAAVRPLEDWDALAMWTSKAVIFFDFRHIPVEFFTAHHPPSHQNYPILVSLLESMWFRSAGQVNTQAVHVQLWLLLIGFVWAVGYVAGRRGVPVLLWGPLLLIMALAPGTSSQLLTGLADIPMVLFAGLAVLLVGLWISDHDWRHLALGVLFFCAVANTKNEGIPIAVITLVVAAVAVRGARLWRHAAWGVAAVVASILPWQLWVALNHVPSDPDLPLRRAVDSGWLVGRLGRLGPSLRATGEMVSSNSTWLYIVPIGIAVVLACLVLRVGRRPALFYLASGLLGLVIYMWVYVASPLPIGPYLVTSDYRIVDIFVVIALAAAIHLPVEAQRRRAAGAKSPPRDTDSSENVSHQAAGIGAAD